MTQEIDSQVSDSKEDIENMFADLKAKKETITDEDLSKLYESSEKLAAKYVSSHQSKALSKLLFVMETIEKERELVKLGINTFIYKDDIDFYIDNSSSSSTSRPVKIIELENYEREIPDQIVEVIEKTSGIFDQLYVVFTDYTGKIEKRIEAERRVADPILFGVFINVNKRVCSDRFYFLGDWEDEYCDLTLDKLLAELSKFERSERKIYTPKTLEELKEYVNNHKSKVQSNMNNVYFESMTTPLVYDQRGKKKSWFDKIRTFFK